MLAKLWDIISYIDWSELAKIITSIWMAIIATKALTTWKRQLKATKKTELLDSLTTTINDCKTQFPTAIWHFKVVKIGFESHIPQGTEDKRKGAIEYIIKKGEEDSKILMESLTPIKEKRKKINLLVIKLQMYDFIDFNECYKAIDSIINMLYEHLETVAMFIKRGHLNWENPKIIKMLDSIIDSDPEKMENTIQKEYQKFLKFTEKNYKRIM